MNEIIFQQFLPFFTLYVHTLKIANYDNIYLLQIAPGVQVNITLKLSLLRFTQMTLCFVPTHVSWYLNSVNFVFCLSPH